MDDVDVEGELEWWKVGECFRTVLPRNSDSEHSHLICPCPPAKLDEHYWATHTGLRDRAYQSWLLSGIRGTLIT